MGAASRILSETIFRGPETSGVTSVIRRAEAHEICSVAIDVAADAPRPVILVVDKREQRQPQAPMRLVKSMRHAMSPAAARHLAQLLQLAAARAEQLGAEAFGG